MENATKNWEQMTYPFFNIKLNYNLGALSPFIDEKTMRVHYGEILQNYISNLNKILEQRLDLQKLTLTELIDYATKNQEQDLLRYAGGVYNHFFYFTELRPATGQIVIGITPQATQEITNAFGGWKNFKEKFTEYALSVFGSGYTWLIRNDQKELEIRNTSNQRVPQDGTPILCLDVWEHAYFLNYLDKRQGYIDAFWNNVDWVKFSERI
ncbi:MAG: superoxide dismutase [Clostridia bacterium]|nr:superoxide dismutase [Clostridia bacterium]